MSATASQAFVGDRSYFEGEVSRYSPVLFQVALRRLRNIEDAEDAVQEALLSAHKCIGQFQGRSKFSTWLTRIVTNAALMKLRRHARYEMLPLDPGGENEGAAFVDELMDGGPSPEAIYAKTEMGETLRRALARLSPKQRTAIQLCELDGISVREAARALGISKNTLKSRVTRARGRLTLLLGEAIPARRTTGAAFAVSRTGAVRRSVSQEKRIFSRAKMQRKRVHIHYPPHILEIATPHHPQNYAT